MTAARHWAYGLIGRPYRRDAAGPDCFDCWGLVRHVFREQLSIEMPFVAVGEEGNLRAIRRAVAVSGWRPVRSGGPKEWDIVTMRSPWGPHVGVMVRANGGLLMLHAVQGLGVCAQTLEELPVQGYQALRWWRRVEGVAC